MDRQTPQLGAVLRAVRRQKDWTLSDVSARTGLPVSTLSKVENGKMGLNYDKLVRLSEGLEIDIAQLFATGPAKGLAAHSGRRSITRLGEGYSIETEKYGHLYPAADLLNKHFIPIIAEIRARSLAEFGEFIRHAGEEFAYVIEGAVELHTDLYAPVHLNTGDSIYFDSGIGHAYIAAAPGRCRVLSICSASEAQIHSALQAKGAPRATAARKHAPAAQRKPVSKKKTRRTR